MKILRNLLSQFLILMIRGYQVSLSRVLPPLCRHTPSCSQYAVEAISRHGPFRGIALAMGRLFKCHPWGTHGYDPVPPHKCCYADKNL